MPIVPVAIPHSPQGLLLFAASCVIAPCVAIVLAAVLRNFVQARQAGAVRDERKSPVATGSMLGFLFLYYLLIRSRVGTLAIDSMIALIILTVMGLVLVVVGTIVNVIGRQYLGSNWANQVTLYENQSLVRKGVFGIVRHPLYASLIWMFCGASLVYHNLIAFLATIFIFVPAMYWRAKQEEALLAERFPDYAQYRSEVSMFVPRLRKGTG
jgi:protein-S-isoprenylcysteine O-methyltransferase Ste14